MAATVKTLLDLKEEIDALVAAGHGAKEVGMPDTSDGRVGGLEVEENDTPADGHPGFVWLREGSYKRCSESGAVAEAPSGDRGPAGTTMANQA